MSHSRGRRSAGYGTAGVFPVDARERNPHTPWELVGAARESVNPSLRTVHRWAPFVGEHGSSVGTVRLIKDIEPEELLRSVRVRPTIPAPTPRLSNHQVGVLVDAARWWTLLVGAAPFDAGVHGRARLVQDPVRRLQVLAAIIGTHAPAEIAAPDRNRRGAFGAVGAVATAIRADRTVR